MEDMLPTTGLIVVPNFRGFGLATKIKTLVFNHARNKFPNAKIFGITTSLPVMKINSSLGYQPGNIFRITSR